MLIRAGARWAFWLACVAILAAALTPARDHPVSLTPWDKADHIIAFYVLSLLALAAFPRIKPHVLAAALSALGAAIEVIQATPLIGRDGDVVDWVADTLAIAAATAPLALGWWRGLARGSDAIPPAP